MYALVLLSCLLAVSQAQFPGAYPGGPAAHYASPGAPPAPVGQDGTVVDTPEVAQAKAAHFAEFARAAARAAEDKSVDNGAYEPQYHQGAPIQAQPQYSGYPGASAGPSPFARASYPGAPSAPVAYQPGPAPAYHQQAHFTPEPKSFQVPAGAKAPFVPAPLAEDGTVVDTPEVAALKAARLQELAAAEARAYKYGADEYAHEGQGQYQPGPSPAQYQAPGPRTAYPGAPQTFAPTARAYQPSAQPIYPGQPQPGYPGQPQPGYPGQPQSYQSQY